MQVFSGGWHAVIFQEVGMQLFFRRLACNLQVFLTVLCIVSIQMFSHGGKKVFFIVGWHANVLKRVGMQIIHTGLGCNISQGVGMTIISDDWHAIFSNGVGTQYFLRGFEYIFFQGVDMQYFLRRMESNISNNSNITVYNNNLVTTLKLHACKHK